MTVYVDERSGTGTGANGATCSPTISTNCIALRRTVGLHRMSYQGPPKTQHPHYDLTSFERRRAIRYGAEPCDRTAMVMVVRKLRRQTAASA